MTDQERREYNALSKNEQRKYDQAKNEHPNWSHSQCLAMAKITGGLEKKIGEGRDINDAEVLQEVLIQAKRWLETIANISAKVLSAIDEAINRIGAFISNAWDWTKDIFADLIDWLNDLF